MSNSDLAIRCWILGEGYRHTFKIRISRNEDVEALKLAIKTVNQNTFKDLDARSLVLYNASIPLTPQLAEHAAALELNKLRLDAADELSEVFAKGLLDRHVHVIVGTHSRTWVYVVLSSLR
jgi:hypothetical protein